MSVMSMCRKCEEIEEISYYLLRKCDLIAAITQSVTGKSFLNLKNIGA